ncbi:MAG: lactate racemase domain-containing protein [Candidatus Thorarchaeota archaeon]
MEIPYGDGFLPVDTGLMNSIEHLNPKRVVFPPDLETLIFNQVESSGILRSVASQTTKESDVVLVIDNPLQLTNPDIMINAVIKSLQTRAIPQSSLSIILLLPQYARTQLDDVMESLGNPGAKGCQIHIHDERRKDSLGYLGDTPNHSIPVHLNSLYTEASLRILVSSTRPHIFTGASGGVTSISFGLCGQKTLLRLQKLVVQRKLKQLMIDDQVGIASSDIVDFCPPDLSINAVQDNYGTTAQVLVGDVKETWKQSSKTSEELSRVRFGRRADIAIVGAGGRGFDGTLYQALPSLYAGLSATRTGGSIIFIAECSHGPGYDGFVKAVASTHSEKEVAVFGETNFDLGMDRSRFFWRVLESRNLIICSRLRESLVTEKLHATAVRDPQEGLDLAIKHLGTDSKIVMIENGSNLIPDQS